MGVVEGENLGAQVDASCCSHLCLVLLDGPYISTGPSSERSSSGHTNGSAGQLAVFGWHDGVVFGLYGLDVGALESKSVFWPGRTKN